MAWRHVGLGLKRREDVAGDGLAGRGGRALDVAGVDLRARRYAFGVTWTRPMGVSRPTMARTSSVSSDASGMGEA